MLSRITVENESWQLGVCGEEGRPDQKGKKNSPKSEKSVHFLQNSHKHTLKDYKHPELSLL